MLRKTNIDRNSVIVNDKIDFVVLWVDGNDQAWLDQKKQYSSERANYSNNANRFRDWDNLQYWFRGVEQFAPWVNNVYFVTWGHLPRWLNTNHPKLKVVKHADYIPEEYLPTFNSDVIETNLHRINELSETFVLFNDDVFLIDDVKPKDFFVDGKPCDSFVENLIAAGGYESRIRHTKMENTSIINANFNKREVHKQYRRKVYNWRYGLQNLITLYFSPFPYFTGFRNPHIAYSHLKSTFSTVWEVSGDKMHEACLNRFRGYNDISQWLMRYWNLCSGVFVPRSVYFGKYFVASKDNMTLCSYIRNKKGKVICINDQSTDFDFDMAKNEINAALNDILPEKCSYEK